jgi:murein DD-endopeptidase MepM/ murein hydrolase activator NlpD
MDPVQNDKDRSVTVSAHNRETYEVTITLNAKLKNMTSSVKFPYTRALAGGFAQPVLKLVSNPQGDWEWEYSWKWIVGSLNARHDDSVIYDLPYRGARKVIQGFRGRFSHTGENEYAVDWDMPVGAAVHAAREGTVVAARSTMNKGGPNSQFGEFSNYIWIRHPDGTIGSYEHLKQHGVVVKGGDRISRKQLIGYSGNTGWTGGPHLHFSVTRPIDGSKYQTFPIRFQTAVGIITPTEGRSYSPPDDTR